MTASTAAVDLKKTFRGPLLGPDDNGYDAARRVWNGNVDREPSLMARCAARARQRQPDGLRQSRTEAGL